MQQLLAPPRSALLRLSTAGSVDDGKSTLIGRLLYESRAVLEDHLAAVERASQQMGADYTNLALLTDGLRAEREQGITIDVAYRHFATPRRRFILADTPGHVQYTRNMVTGTSTADITLVLLDARKGITEQSRRHLFIAALIGVPHVAVCVNKMDLVAFDEVVFDELAAEVDRLTASLGVPQASCFPISALLGDNILERSENTPWYGGPTLMQHLEQVDVGDAVRTTAARLPVQMVVRPLRNTHHDYRGYAGQVAGGVVRPGDEVVVLPSGIRTRISALDTFDGPLAEAVAPANVVVRVEGEHDIARGDMFASPGDAPGVRHELDVVMCWFSHTPLRVGGRYVVKHTTRSARAIVSDLHARVDVSTFGHQPHDNTLGLNDVGRVTLRLMTPLIVDTYARNRVTGSLIVIDEATNETVAAGTVQE